MNGYRCLCLLGELWRARSQLAAREVLAVRREAARNRMVPNRMVPVGGELGVAITTEQERIEAAFHDFHEGPPYRRGAAARNTSSGGSTEAKIWGRRPGVGPLQASKSGLGAPQGQRR